MTTHWKAVEQYFTVVLFGFQFYAGVILEKFINFVLRTIRMKGLKLTLPNFNEKPDHKFVPSYQNSSLIVCNCSLDVVNKGKNYFTFICILG